MNYKVLVFVLAGCFLFTGKTAAQVVDSSSSESPSPDKAQRFFGGFASGYSGTSPKITAETYHLGFALGKEGGNYWDLYLCNSVPTIPPNNGDTVEYVSNDIRRQLGGLANFSLSKVGYFGYGGDRSIRDIKGFQTDFRFGVKMVDVPIRRSGTDFLIPIFQSTFDFRYLIPLVPPRKATDGNSKFDVRKNMVGNLSFRVSGSYMTVMNTTNYNLYYASKKGVIPNPNLLVVTPEMSFYVTNQLYFSVGYSYNNYNFIENAIFFQVSYGKPKGS